MDSMKRLLTGLDQATRRELKKNLEQRKDELNRKGITSSSSLAKSPILQAVVDAAAKNAMEERDAILSSIDDIIDEKYDNKIEAFIRDRPNALLTMEIQQLERLADKIIKTTTDTLTAVAKGWPMATSTNTRKSRKQLKAQYNALGQRARSAADILADTKLLLDDFQIRKTMEGHEEDTNHYKLIGTIASTSNLCHEIMGVLGDIAISLMVAARDIGKGKPFFLGLKADQNLVPTSAIKSAVDFYHSYNSVMQSLQGLPGMQGSTKIEQRRPSESVGRFLNNVATKASLEGGDRLIPSIEQQLEKAKASGKPWTKVQSEAMDVPFNPDTHKQDFYGNIVPLSPDELESKRLGLKTAREKGAIGEVQANPAMNCGCGQNPCITYGKSNPDPLDDLYV